MSRERWIDWRRPHAEPETFAATEILVVSGKKGDEKLGTQGVDLRGRRVVRSLVARAGGFLPVDLLPSEQEAA